MTKPVKPQTVIPLSNCPAHAVCVTMTSLVNKHDHKKYFRDDIARLYDKQGWIAVLIIFDQNFIGWDPEGAEASWQSILEFGPKDRRVAYINPPDKRVLLHKLSEAIFRGEVKFFQTGEEQAALEWIKEAIDQPALTT